MSSTDTNVALLLHDIHARLSRLEITALALTKTMAEAGTLPPAFAETFTEDLERHAASVKAEQFQNDLRKFGKMWSPIFSELAKPQAKS
ncbi:hypothetical protein I5T99_12655 [Stenotrophomonas maltophilia]|nr:hypothetical protein [Stenotrophomonas maltophilia]